MAKGQGLKRKMAVIRMTVGEHDRLRRLAGEAGIGAYVRSLIRRADEGASMPSRPQRAGRVQEAS